MERRPLVLDGGLVRQLPPGDSLPGMGSSDPNRLLEYIATSRVVTAPFDGHVRFRCMGAAGGGARGANARGGNGGTVAKTVLIPVLAGDQFVITIPAGGLGRATTDGDGLAGGTLTIVRAGSTIISIPGGIGGVNADAMPGNNTAPTGADWYVLGGRGGNGNQSGGGGAMIVEGGTAAGRGGDGTQSGGGGATGNGGDFNNSHGGGLLDHATSYGPGAGFIAPEDCVLLFVMMTACGNRGQPFMGGYGAANGWGGFGAGGAGTSISNYGGFAGGGGGSSAGLCHGGFGGGGGGTGVSGVAGNGGQGFVTVEWLRG